ncbi:MAG: aldo/keto reductase [Deltaproteobacteria bacterium]|nr:aldo/keto reductase [Deltaproteobacteria bacterium]
MIGVREREQCRDQVVLATKFRFASGRRLPQERGSRYRILRWVERARSRLRTDRIDLYQIHMQDLTPDEDETPRAPRRPGDVPARRALHRLSNYAAYRLTDSL